MGLDIKKLDDTRREKERRINRLGHELKKIDRDVEYKLATYVEHTDELDTLARIYEESKENLDEFIGDKDGVEFLNEMVDALMSAVEYYQAKVKCDNNRFDAWDTYYKGYEASLTSWALLMDYMVDYIGVLKQEIEVLNGAERIVDEEREKQLDELVHLENEFRLFIHVMVLNKQVECSKKRERVLMRKKKLTGKEVYYEKVDSIAEGMKKILEMGCLDTGKYDDDDDDISSNVPGCWTARTVSPEEAEQLMGNVDVNDDTMAFADRPSAVATANYDFMMDDDLPDDLPDDVEEDKPNTKTKKTRKKK